MDNTNLIFGTSLLLEDIGLSHRWALALTGLLLSVLIGIFSWLAYRLCKRYLRHLVFPFLRINPVLADKLQQSDLVIRLSYLAPLALLYNTIDLVEIDEVSLTITFVAIVKKILYVTIVIAFSSAIHSALVVLEQFYETFAISRKRPVKVYLQVVSGGIYAFAAILVAAELLGTSPWGFFTGLGAATALLALMFKDSILGLVASVQISAFDVLRIGDWVTMSQFNADGQVTEISLTIVKIRNFDNSQTTIPTHAFLSHGVQNWRSMQESGARRIRRAFLIDMRSIRFLDEAGITALKEGKPSWFIEAIDAVPQGSALTNLELFRQVVLNYLKKRHDLHQSKFDLVLRVLPSNEFGLPLEVYGFAKDISFVAFERVQIEIVDYVFATLNLFQLSVYQK